MTVGWLLYLITLLPVIGILQVGGQARADRYTYVPLIGLFIMIIWLADEAARKNPSFRVILGVGGAVVLVFAGFQTSKTVSYWKDDVALFGRAVAVTTDNGRMKVDLANA